MVKTSYQQWKELRERSAKKAWEKRKSNPRQIVDSSKPRKPIPKVSKKLAKQRRVYEKNKATYFETVEHCEFPGCEVTNVTLHHAAGRIGDKLTDLSNFVALCWAHHQWCEEHPIEAKELGLSVSRLQN